MARKRVVALDDPYLSMLSGLGASGRPGQVAARFPNPGHIRTGFKIHLITVNHPEGTYYPVIFQSDLEALNERPTALKVFRQRQWVGGMGQRVMSDPNKFMVSAAYTLRMNEFLPQPFAITAITGELAGHTVGEYQGVPVKILEWQGYAPSGQTPAGRRLYMATYDVSTTPTVRIYMLKSSGVTTPRLGWWLWKTFTGWQYSDFTIIQKSTDRDSTSELRLLGSQQGYGPDRAESKFWKATANTHQASDWSQGDACHEHQVTTPDGNYGSYQSTFYYPNDSIKVGTNEVGNYITNVVLFNGVVVIIKPEGVYIYRKSGNLVELKVNLRSYFDVDTGKQAVQWGQVLYFNTGKLLCSFDGEKIVINPPIWDWADPEWIPPVRGLANCGEGLGVAFDGRTAIFDGRDWHNLYRKSAWALAWSTAYNTSVDRGYPIVVTCDYPDGTGYGTTRIFEFYPSFFRPLTPETKSEPSFLVSSAFETDDNTMLMFRNFQVKARNLALTFGIRVWGRSEFYPDSTVGFIPMPGYPNGQNIQYGSELETWYTFTVPALLATLTGFQYKIELCPAVAGQMPDFMPAVTDVRINVHQRDAAHRRRWDFQLLCMDDYEFPDGTTGDRGAAEMASILWEAQYQESPVRLGFWQPGTPGREPCWVYYDVILKAVQHVAYVDEADVTGYIHQISTQEV